MIRNLKIGSKFILAFGLISLFMFLSTTVGVLSLNNVGNAFHVFYDQSHQMTRQGYLMEIALEEGEKSILSALTSSTTSQAQQRLEEAEEYFANSQEYARELQLLAGNAWPEAEDLLSQLAEGIAVRQSLYAALLSEENENLSWAQTRSATTFYNNNVQPLFAGYRHTIDTLLSNIENQALQSRNNVITTQNGATRLMIISAAITLLLSIIIGIKLRNALCTPVEQIRQAAQQMAKGNYEVQLTYRSKDEIGQMSDSLRNMILSTKTVLTDTARILREIGNGNFNVTTEAEYLGVYHLIETGTQEILQKLSRTILDIGVASGEVEMCAQQASNFSRALSHGSTEQAASIEELAATMEAISKKISISAENAHLAKKKSQQSQDAVEGSNQKMSEMTTAIEEISDRSAQIEKIVKTIEDIAFQTNILALNAAVEAARAGAAGKGFAVVADEVRNLASKSAQAVKNTSELIESTVRAVERGTSIAQEAADAMIQVVGDTKQVMGLIDEITDAADEQSTAVSQVSAGVGRISSVVQSNSASASDADAASQALSMQAEKLRVLVSSFTPLKSVAPLYQETGSAEAGGHGASEASVPNIQHKKAIPDFLMAGSAALSNY